MKKGLFLAALVLISASGFAQKKNVNIARSRAMAEDAPDFVGAREAIKSALENEETKNLPNTWYVAGLIGCQESNVMRQNSYLGQEIDQDKKGQAIMESYDYWMKAIQLSEQPISIDKKGKAKYDTKSNKLIAAKLQEEYLNSDFFNYGSYLYQQEDYRGAYKAFANHLAIPQLRIMDEKQKAAMPMDTIYEQIKFYTGIAAAQADMHPEAIAIFEDLKDGSYQPAQCTNYLFQEYEANKDTANAIKVLEAAAKKYPEEPAFIQNLINHYIFSNKMDEAIAYLNQAIAADPKNAQYQMVLGNLEANQKHYDAAVEAYSKAIAIDPSLADAHAGLGRVYFNEARDKNDAADGLTGKEYKKVLDEMDELCHKALPYLEKAHELNPEDVDYMRLLMVLYGRFEMTDKYNEITKKLGY